MISGTICGGNGTAVGSVADADNLVKALEICVEDALLMTEHRHR
jgi:hypothetical protein